MSEEKFILTEEQIRKYSKVLDGAVNWTKIFGKVKFLLFFNIDLGKLIENKDRDTWAKLLKLVNSMYAKGKISDSLAGLISQIFAAIDNSDEDSLVSSLSSAIAGKINFLNNDSKEEVLIKSALTMLSTLDDDFLDDLNREFAELESNAELTD